MTAGPIELSPLSSMQSDHHNTHSVFTLGIEDEVRVCYSVSAALGHDIAQHACSTLP